MMRELRDMIGKHWLFAAAACVPSGCLDLDSVQNQNDADLARALTTPEAVESLLNGSFVWHWHVDTDEYPGMAMQVAADGTSSSWGNFGMRDSGSEPRVPFQNSATYEYAAINEFPWARIYFALSGVRQAMNAADDPDFTDRLQREFDQDRIDRMEAFGRLIQALSFSNLALIFDQGSVISEATDLSDTTALKFKPYAEVWDSALAMYGEFIQLAEGAAWEIPSEWVGCDGAWSPQRSIEVARAYRAQYAAGLARNPEERAAADWDAIAADAASALGGIDGLAGNYAPNDDCGWAWTGARWPTLLLDDWGRADLHWIGPADASGAWERWIASDLDDRRPFDIDTDDRRVTGGSVDTDGKYIQYMGNCPFRLERGVYHCSDYRDFRWDWIYDAQFQTQWPILTDKSLEFLIAEADYRRGDMSSAMELVNRYRVQSGELPPFTNPGGVAPGGSRCVPQNADGTCGDLWEALKWEKRIEVYEGYGVVSGHFIDDRGWGDLEEGTWEQLPVPALELELLGYPVYTFPETGSAKLGNNMAVPSMFRVSEGESERTIDEKVRVQLGLMEAAAAGLRLEGVSRTRENIVR